MIDRPRGRGTVIIRTDTQMHTIPREELRFVELACEVWPELTSELTWWEVRYKLSSDTEQRVITTLVPKAEDDKASTDKRHWLARQIYDAITDRNLQQENLDLTLTTIELVHTRFRRPYRP